MIKIAFVMTSLDTGGISTSLENLLKELSLNKNICIDLILFHSNIEDKLLIPENVKIIKSKKITELMAVSQRQSKNIGLGYSILRFFLVILCKFFGHGLSYKIILAFSHKFKGYDIAISCSQSSPINRLYGGCNEFVLKNIKAKKKISFIHCDYVSYGINNAYSHKIYSQFDKIAAVSNSVKKIFITEEPLLAYKTQSVYNCNNINKIISYSRENSYIYNDEILNFVTVARLGIEKGHIRVIQALNNLISKGISFKWHIVGGTKEEAPKSLIDLINKNNLWEYIFFHGNTKNPYRFMVNASFILVPSYHEAAPMVFDEACILNLPILTTNTVSAIELVKNKGIGLVCDNTDLGILKALEDVALNPHLLKEYKKNTYKNKYTNKKPLEQFNKLIEFNETN